MSEPIWTPSPERVSSANMTRFMKFVQGVDSYSDLYHWSIVHPEDFWPAMWQFGEVIT